MSDFAFLLATDTPRDRLSRSGETSVAKLCVYAYQEAKCKSKHMFLIALGKRPRTIAQTQPKQRTRHTENQTYITIYKPPPGKYLQIHLA